jgi:PKD repeat protein
MRNLIILIFLCSLFSSNLVGQRSCGADHQHDEKMKDPEYRYYFDIAERAVKSKINSGARFSCTGTITIPLAFHFNGGITNSNMACIMSQVNSQIKTLNEDFGGYNTDKTNYNALSTACPTQFPASALGNTSCIQFCLAGILPAGETSAITFGRYEYPNAPGWTGIFNVFVSDVAPILNPPLPSTILGVAGTGAASNPNGTNGMYIKNFAFGSAAGCTSGISINNTSRFNKGRTGTHEAGHYFGLQHIFKGCNNGDGIADTPDQSIDNGNIAMPVVNTTNCTSNANNSCGTLDFFFNYMDYVDDKFMYMFTDDQMQVMNGYAGPQSKWTGGCVSTAPPVANFRSNYTGTPLCAALAMINFEDLSTNFPSSWSWTFSGAGVSPAASTQQNPKVTFSSSGTITATLTATNNAGKSVVKTISIPVSVASPSSCGNCGQTFADDGGSSGNYTPNDRMYVLCASDPAQTVQVDFTKIALEEFMGGLETTDHITVYNGATATGTPANYIFGTNIYRLNGSSYTPIGTTFVGNQQCATFVFDYSNNAANATFAGWAANVTCIAVPTCSDGKQNQNETFVDCGGVCPPCPDICNNFTFTDIGGTTGPAGTSQKTWQVCAPAPEKVIVDFTSIDLGSGTAQLLAFEGTSATGRPAYLLSGTNTFKDNGTTYLPAGNNTISSLNQCFTFVYIGGASPGVVPGWVASINCCGIKCPNATNAGRPIVNQMVSSVCPGYNLSNLTMFRNQGSGDRACSTPNLEFNTFYMVKCDATTGTLGVDVGPNTSGGNVQAALYGPVTGGCPNFSGGSYVDCKDGTDPARLTVIDARPNAVYAIVISSARAGDFMINTTYQPVALPVELSAFKASTDEDNVTLSWTTEQEVNNERFDLERSIDGSNFVTITSLAGKGNSQVKTEYNFVDENLSNGTYFYRLKQIDFDKQTTYSDMISAEVISNNVFKIFPNPTSSSIFIETIGTVDEVYITNVMGQLMTVKFDQKNQNRKELDLIHYPPGHYHIHVKIDGKDYKKHFIKLE